MSLEGQYRAYKIRKAIRRLNKSEKKLQKARQRRIDIQNGKRPWWF